MGWRSGQHPIGLVKDTDVAYLLGPGGLSRGHVVDVESRP